METSINWELIIALCAVAISVASPVLTSWINGSQESKKFYRENYYEHRAKIIEDYIAAASIQTAILNDPDSAAYERTYSQTKNYHEVQLYVSEKCRVEIQALEEQFRNETSDSYKRLDIIISLLTREPPRQKP
ncbi:MAG: hypothetical protein CVV04_11935 [Firmicutes bacterium HGW-Firmicutes-9]|jgi:hypothetical protein|nr:MAG: hypothetical protein CVV04_11935 [Firmicutes bacterium HGW-Firmicutes-9]